MKSSYVKLVLIVLVCALAVYFHWRWGYAFSLEALRAKEQELRNYYASHPGLTLGMFIALYCFLVAASLPVAAVMSLGAGAIFGFFVGVLAVSVASTTGAMLAFWLSRYVLRDWVRRSFGEKLRNIDSRIEKEGALYLFTLRLVPIFPFFVINLALGLSRMEARLFFLISLLAMLPATLLYVNAGTQLATVDSLGDVLSVRVLGSLAVLGIFPLCAKKIIHWIRSRNDVSQI